VTGVHDGGSRRRFTTKVHDGRSLLAGDRKARPTPMTREVVGFLGSGRIVDSARRTLGCVGWIHDVAIRTLIGGARQVRAGRVHRVTPDPLCPQHSCPARFAGHRADQRIVFDFHLAATTVHRPRLNSPQSSTGAGPIAINGISSKREAIENLLADVVLQRQDASKRVLGRL
jgi:hypothetical protein